MLPGEIKHESRNGGGMKSRHLEWQACSLTHAKNETSKATAWEQICSAEKVQSCSAIVWMGWSEANWSRCVIPDQMILFVSTVSSKVVRPQFCPLKGPKISSFCHAPHPHVQVTDVSFTTVLNAEPVLKSAIVNGHHFRALLDTENIFY